MQGILYYRYTMKYNGTRIFKVQHGIKTQVMQTCREYTILASCTAKHPEPKHGPEV